MRWAKWRGPPGSRRAFLGGAAAALTLPWLPSLYPARSALPTPPVRFVAWFSPNGWYQDAWKAPVGALGDDLPRTLEPLRALRGELLQLSGFDNRPAIREFKGDHARGTGGSLTCSECIDHDDGTLENGISLDQAIANAIGHQTPFSSLELGTTGGAQVGNCDTGFSCAYSQHVSWDDANTPRPRIIDPQQLFDRLFAGSDTMQSAEESDRRQALRASVLDHVLQDATAIRPQLTASDRDKLDEYMTAVREVEQQIAPADIDVEDPVGKASEFPDLVRAMNDLMVLALEHDLTRVITFMAENGGAYRYMHHLGITRAHHELSHHGWDPYKIELLLQIEAWYAGEFAYLVDRLQQTADPYGGTLLENSLVMLTSEMSDGDGHLHTDLPVLLAGRAGGAMQPGRHLAFSDSPPLADLYATLANLAGAPLTRFGADGTGPISLG